MSTQRKAETSLSFLGWRRSFSFRIFQNFATNEKKKKFTEPLIIPGSVSFTDPPSCLGSAFSANINIFSLSQRKKISETVLQWKRSLFSQMGVQWSRSEWIRKKNKDICLLRESVRQGSQSWDYKFHKCWVFEFFFPNILDANQ